MGHETSQDAAEDDQQLVVGEVFGTTFTPLATLFINDARVAIESLTDSPLLISAVAEQDAGRRTRFSVHSSGRGTIVDLVAFESAQGARFHLSGRPFGRVSVQNNGPHPLKIRGTLLPATEQKFVECECAPGIETLLLRVYADPWGVETLAKSHID